MLTESIEQAKLLVEKSRRILIVFKNDLTGDSLCAALALSNSLKANGKQIELVSTDGPLEKFLFLPGERLIQSGPSESEGTLLFRIKNGRAKISELWYEQKENDLEVFISAKPETAFKKTDVEIEVKGAKIDLIVAVGLAAPEQAGRVFEQHAVTFFETPIINIDLSSANDGYGAVNLIDLTASSNSEIVYEFLRTWPNDLIKAEVATALLAGLMAKTDSFQGLKTTPRALFAAANLLEKGADHQTIIRNLYKTKTFGLLKLWGKALAKLTMHPQYQFVISSLSAADLKESKAGQADLEHVLEELASTLSDAKLIILSAEIGPNQTSTYVFAKPQLNIEEVLLEFKASKTKPGLASFEIGGHPLEAAVQIVENKFLDWLKSIQPV